MRVKEHVRIYKEELFVSEDGRIFSCEEDCRKYERQCLLLQKLNQIPTTISDNYAWYFCRTKDEFSTILNFLCEQGGVVIRPGSIDYDAADWYGFKPERKGTTVNYQVTSLKQRGIAWERFGLVPR